MSSAVASDVRRVAVETEAGSLDLALPANIAVLALIPSITELAQLTGSSREVPTDWRLSRVDGGPLSQRYSLHDNGIRDGDLLVLSRFGSAEPPSRTDDATAGFAVSLDSYPRWTPAASTIAGSIIALCCCGLAGYALLQGNRHTAAVVAGLLSVVAFVAAVTCGRVYGQAVAAVALGGCAVVCASVAGYRAVPGDLVAPRLVLTAAVCATVSIVTTRCAGAGTAVFAATASAGVLAAVTAGLYTFVPLGVGAAGALLAATAIGMLTVSARLALWTGRVRVPQLAASPPRVDTDPICAHAMSTGLVGGSCAAAALGAVLTTHDSHLSNAVFAAVIGLVLAMRAGTHVDLLQVSALTVGGATCFAAVFLCAVSSRPYDAHWISLAAAGVSAACIALSAAPSSVPVSPLARRCVELGEYAALAAVVPLACWVGGVFGAVRGL